MKIKYIHKVKNQNIKIGDVAEVSDLVGRELITGGYAVEITEPYTPNAKTVKVKYVREVTSPAYQAGKVGDIKEIGIILAKHLMAEGYVEEYKERIITNETVDESSNTGSRGHQKRTRTRS